MTSMSEPLHIQLQPFFLARKKFYQLLFLLFQQPTNKLLKEIRDKQDDLAEKVFFNKEFPVK